MAQALFCVLPRTDALGRIGRELKRAGIHSHSISTLSFGSNTPAAAPNQKARRGIDATGQLKWAIQGATSTGETRRIARALAGMGMSEASARHYQDLVRTGNTLLCIFCDTLTQAKQVITVLRRAGALELASTGASKKSREQAADEA